MEVNKIKNDEVEERNKKFEELKTLLDKQIEIERIKQKRTPIWKIITYIFVGLASVSFLAFCCFMMYTQSFTMETLLTVLLSFFSIALSIMFYIQSEKSSTSYYMRSYEIMKEVSVTLGKIEASFGEKLANINSNLEKFDINKKEVKEKIEQGEKEQEQIKEKITKGNLSQEERVNLLNQLQEKTEENYALKRKLELMDARHSRDIQMRSQIIKKMASQENMINELMHGEKARSHIINKSFNDDFNY